jgi:protease-4
VQRLVNEGPYTADESRSLGLVDTVLYDAEVDSLAIDDQSEDVTALSFTRYLSRIRGARVGPHIALITASGTIMPGKSVNPPGDEQIMGSETMIDALDEARTRDAIKAVVLRIDSPGGSVQASDDIWREVKRLADEKPVIVSMSDLAASGGYYIAVPAQEIVAQPSTLTGSIGVFGGKLNIMGLLKKVGVNVETVSRGQHAQMMSPYRDFTPDERHLYQQQIEDAYRLFLSHVEDGRGMTHVEADSLARGRVWSGVDAYEIGLVDTLGGLETAIQLACDAAGIKHRDPLVIETLPHVQHHWYETMIDDLFDNNQNDDSSQERALFSPIVRAWWTASRVQAGMVFALMPFSVEIR